MEYTLLTDLEPHKKHATIQVCITRKWLFRGANDNAPLQHVDMILSDQKGNAIYAEIPANLANQKAPDIEEGRIYNISRFRVCAAKNGFKVVDGDKMIQFTFYTIVKRVIDPPTVFPKYIYRLTPFDQIESNIQTKPNFLDVLGVIIQVHELTPIHIQSQLNPVLTRSIIIEDLSNTPLKITLWADQATSFSLHDVYDPNTKKPIIVLFVGCLPKFYKGVYLSGGSACRWYFNPTIPEAEPYHTSQQTRTIALQLPHALNHPPTIENKEAAESKSLYDLIRINPYDFPEIGYECTVTITEIPVENKWWYPACTKCFKASTPQNTVYHCNDCNWDKYTFRYKLKFLASDGTETAQMFCFNNIARQIVGKSCEIVLRGVSEHSSIPPDLAQIISLKFTFRVTVDDQSFFQENNHPNVLRINSIVTAHGRQQSLPMQAHNLEQQGPSTPSNTSKQKLFEDSPSTALEKLSTTTSTAVTKKLLYPTNDGTTKPPTSIDITDAENDDIDEGNIEHDAILDNKGKGPAATIESPPKRFKHGSLCIKEKSDTKSSKN
ncbi:uncharacterized protein LOC100274860 [Zea mays]|uniref:uncharacterized protein LOC100274860 n=1 Tax=Zea mays TaxID=4577 RepID=UPI0006235AA7|nr:uncharacterized protein LOC100274860 [Zea mays]|eukprot:NP_001142593.2 uncharacterized protein LOC100274860 [Zea mays]